MRGLLVLVFWIGVGYFLGAKWPSLAQKVGIA
jgi:hypothetical protein